MWQDARAERTGARRASPRAVPILRRQLARQPRGALSVVSHASRRSRPTWIGGLPAPRRRQEGRNQTGVPPPRAESAQGPGPTTTTAAPGAGVRARRRGTLAAADRARARRVPPDRLELALGRRSAAGILTRARPGSSVGRARV